MVLGECDKLKLNGLFLVLEYCCNLGWKYFVWYLFDGFFFICWIDYFVVLCFIVWSILCLNYFGFLIYMCDLILYIIMFLWINIKVFVVCKCMFIMEYGEFRDFDV